MRCGFRHLLRAGALTTILAAGCNSVLGIEEAHLDVSMGGTSSGGTGNPGDNQRQVPPISTCDGPQGTCGSCVQTSCSAERTNALLDNDARKAINEYRKCLGVDCEDPEDLCLEALTASAASQLAGCVQTHCSTDCKNSPLVSTADLYCACMPDHCPTQVNGFGTTCAAAAAAVSLEDLGCRLLHCEFAIPNFGGHCVHAVGEGFCPVEDPISTCTTLNMSGYPCNNDYECCTMRCGGGNICD
jgi:hypothetical protein